MPLQHVFVIWVVGVSHHIKEVGITRPTADILLRASIVAVDAIRHLRTGSSGQFLFE